MKPDFKLLQRIHDAAEKCVLPSRPGFYMLNKSTCLLGCAHKVDPELPYSNPQQSMEELIISSNQWVELFLYKEGLDEHDKEAWLQNLQSFIDKK